MPVTEILVSAFFDLWDSKGILTDFKYKKNHIEKTLAFVSEGSTKEINTKEADFLRSLAILFFF